MDWYSLLSWLVGAVVSMLVRQSVMLDLLSELSGRGPNYYATPTTEFLFTDPPRAVTNALSLIEIAVELMGVDRTLDLSPPD